MSRGLLHYLKKSARSFRALVLLCILAGGVTSGQETQDCSVSRLAECRNVLAQKHELPGFGPVFTQDQVHKTCGALLEADQCVLHMYQSCPELQSIPKPGDTLESIHEIQKCRILIDKYVHRLGCYEPLNITYQRCLDKEQDSFQRNIDRVRDGNKELKEEGCCNIRRIFDCILKPTELHCDKGAMGVMEDFLHMSLPSGMSTECLQYKCLSQAEVDANAGSEKRHPENGHDDHAGSVNKNCSPGRQLSFLSLSGVLFLAATNIVYKY